MDDVAPDEPGHSQDKSCFNRSETPDYLPKDAADMADFGYPILEKNFTLAAILRKEPHE
ncbi:MAG: hypothetical protein ACK2U0_15085 [Candidatus Promineifilaceae bacterium]|jgi:hypothetical protein